MNQQEMQQWMAGAKFLIVDDEVANTRLLEVTLEEWNHREVRSTTDPRQVATLFEQWQPDIILLDLMMPHLDGFGVMAKLKPFLPEGVYLPILVLTADVSPQTRRKALAAGAKDFVTKPFDATELLLRVWNLLETRYLYLQQQQHSQILEDKVWERTRELRRSQKSLEESQVEMIQRLAQAAEFRDDETGQHTQRVGEFAGCIAREMGVDDVQVDLIRRAAPLHDVGKIGISDDILLKPGKLSPEELAVMKTHTTVGAHLLAGGQSDLVKTAEQIALSHHERWDGAGYPNGLKGEDIPLPGRVVALADVFDALTHERPYKKAWSREQAAEEIAGQSGRQFDPSVVAAFLRVLEAGRLPVITESPQSLAGEMAHSLAIEAGAVAVG